MYENNYSIGTINDFFKMSGKTITASGRKSYYSGRYEINYSSILTRLIQDAGRFCEFYASDLFIDWSSVEEFVNTWEAGDVVKNYLFGFRKSGVDGNSYVFSRYNNEGSHADRNYRSMWRLDIEIKGEDIEMTLGRVF